MPSSVKRESSVVHVTAMVGGIDGITDMSTSWLPLSRTDQRFQSIGVKLGNRCPVFSSGRKDTFMNWETTIYHSGG